MPKEAKICNRDEGSWLQEAENCILDLGNRPKEAKSCSRD